MDAAVKETLLDQFRDYLDSLDEVPQTVDAEGPETDLFTVFVELAAMRNEMRTESRLLKEALDEFRGAFGTLQSSHATLEQELQRAHADSRERARALLRPCGSAARRTRGCPRSPTRRARRASPSLPCPP